VRPSLFRITLAARGKRVQHLRIDWSNRLNFATDMIVIGAFMSPAAVALWAVPRVAYPDGGVSRVHSLSGSRVRSAAILKPGSGIASRVASRESRLDSSVSILL
jgi:hypothetical protein